MNAQQRGILAAFKHMHILNKTKENTNCIIEHTKPGICPQCKINYVKWTCCDSSNNILKIIYLPSNNN